MAETNRDIHIAEQIEATRKELDQARDVVCALANDLADVADVIEPVLADHITRIRHARMTTLDELRQISAGVQELRNMVLHPDMERTLLQAERLLRACRDLEEFRAVGALDAFLRAFTESEAFK